MFVIPGFFSLIQMSANPKTPLVSGSRPPSHQQQGGPSRSNIDQVKQQVESVKDVMKENIDRAIDRGADIDALNARSQQLDDDARLFKYVSRGEHDHLY